MVGVGAEEIGQTMRRILITPQIESLAQAYADKMEQGAGLAELPAKRLEQLRDDMSLNTTKLKFSKKYPSPKGGRKLNFTGCEWPQYSEYVQMIIDKYSELNNLHPRDYDTVIAEMEAKLPRDMLKVSVKIKKRKAMSFADYIVKAMDYVGVRDRIFKAYISDPLIGIRACVYCNAQYAVTAVKDSKTTLATYDLDHNKPKAIYPYLCTNFYNLQPSCPSCNRHKSANTDVGYSVYYWDQEDPKPLRFEISPADIVRFEVNDECDNITPQLKDNDGQLAFVFNKHFSIDALYKHHKDEVQELLWRHKIYSKSDKEALKAQFATLFSDNFDMDRFILGTYSDAEDAHKRPLTIMKQDVVAQLKEYENRH